MTGSRRNILIIAAIAAALWVVPSFGTRGMGTIGQRFSHPDSDLVAGAETAPAASTARLQHADRVVLATLPQH
jgi:hypothetical protein